jgi:hypothetical protein
MRMCRQLQDRAALTRPQSREQDDLPVGELDRIVMSGGVVLVDLAEPTQPVARVPSGLVEEQRLQHGIIPLHFRFEGDLGARQQADRDRWLAERGKPACKRVAKIGGYQSVADSRWSRGDAVKTVIAHGGAPYFAVIRMSNVDKPAAFPNNRFGNSRTRRRTLPRHARTPLWAASAAPLPDQLVRLSTYRLAAPAGMS